MVICPDCGKEVKDAKFCSNCGSMLPKNDEVVSNEVEEKVDVPIEEETVEEPAEDIVEEEVAEAPTEEAPTEEEVVEVMEEVIDEPVAEEAVEEEVAEEVPEEVVDEPVAEEAVEEEAAEEVPEEVVDEPVAEEAVEEEAAEEAIEVNVKKSKFCANCGTEVPAGTAFCPQCGFKFAQKEKPQTKFCQNCGKKIDINAEICPHCGVRVANVRSSEEKSVLLAAILSFLFPGLGHLYLGLSKKGISFIIAYIVSAILIMFLIGFVLVLIVWVWALIDSIKSTEAINRGEHVEDKLF